VPFAVDNEYFTRLTQQYDKKALREEMGIPQDQPIILFASKLLERKRPLDLLVAFHRLQQEKVSAALVFVGSGEQELQLKHYARKHDLSDVHFLGFKNQSDLPKYYSLADVFVFPAENEPWGLVLNEVMCAGLPIVAAREIGAVPDLLRHGENGFTYEAGDINQLTSYLRQLLEAPEKRMLMGRHSRAIIGQWTYERGVLSVVEALVALRPAGDPIANSQVA
jgi:glycosyltransferase involved in cell wall biosynthesis